MNTKNNFAPYGSIYDNMNYSNYQCGGYIHPRCGCGCGCGGHKPPVQEDCCCESDRFNPPIDNNCSNRCCPYVFFFFPLR